MRLRVSVGIACTGVALTHRVVTILGLAIVLTALSSTGAVSEEGLDARLVALLAGLKQELVRQDPSRASARAVVANFTEHDLPWSTPLAAYLQERAAWLVETSGMFKPALIARTRGITIKQVTGVDNPNDPKALTRFYGSELAIQGSYRREGDRVMLRVAAVDDQGKELAQASGEVPMTAVPGAVAAAQVNTEHTSQMLGAFTRLGPRMQGPWKVEITTSRPGMGASFRQGEAIQYFVTSTTDGYLYLFHVGADLKTVRIFPNQHQPDARVRAGVAVEVPAAGAPFRFEASPPFGLETTFAVVTPTALDEKDFQPVAGGFTKPAGEVPAVVRATRGSGGKPGGAPGATAPPPDRPIVWNSITILVRP
jgi:Domain of unknown function (DUF4384)